MSFVNVGYLWLLPVGLIPIIIYYLLRFRSLRVVWGANYVLERAIERLRKKLHWDQIILMALRILAAVVIVLLFARPISSSTSAHTAGGDVHRVIAIDGSYSMLAGRADQTRWDRAVEAAEKLIGTWGRGTTWSLCFVADEPQWIVEGATIGDGGDAIAKLKSLEPGETAASLPDLFEQIGQRFTNQPVELVLLADDQATTWRGVAETDLPAGLRMDAYWLKPPLQQRANAAVTGVRLSPDRLLANDPARASVSVRNYAAEARKGMSVELRADGSFRARRSISLLGGQETTIHFDTSFDEAGSHYLEARIGGDALAYDNTHAAGVQVAEKMPVLVLRGPSGQGKDKFGSAWGFFEVASRATKMAAKDAAPGSKPAEIAWALHEKEQPPTAEQLAAHDVVYLDGSRKMSPKLAGRLAAYVEAGGGLILSGGPTVAPKQWNELLGEAGLLPARLGQLRSQKIGGQSYRTLQPASIADSALSGFTTRTAGDLSQARFYNRFLLPDVAEGARVLAEFDDGSPWLVERPRGRGHVLLMAAGPGARGNNLIVREFFVPLIHRLFRQAAAGRAFPRTVQPGEPIRMALSEPEGIDALTFGPQGRTGEPIRSRPTEHGPIARVQRDDLASGLYSILTVRGEQSSRMWFGVQGPRADSDLTALPDAERKRAVEKHELAVAESWSELNEQLRAKRGGAEWHHWAALLLAALLLGEMGFQRRFAPSRA